MRSKVIIAVCSDYQEEKVYSCISESVRALGGINRFVSPKEKILVKPNFLSAAIGEQCITTHPSVIRGVLRLLYEEGYKQVKVGDSPASDSCKAAFDSMA